MLINLTTSILGSFSHLQIHFALAFDHEFVFNSRKKELSIPASHRSRNPDPIGQAFLRCIREEFLSWESERKTGIVSSIVVQRRERVGFDIYQGFRRSAVEIIQTVQSLGKKSNLPHRIGSWERGLIGIGTKSKWSGWLVGCNCASVWWNDSVFFF